MLTKICAMLIIASSFYKLGESLTITVDGLMGNDSADCIKGASECKTLDYTISHLQAVGCKNTPITVSIREGVYNYTLDASNKAYQFWNCSKIAIAGVGNGTSTTTIQCNSSGAGFAFYNSNIQIQDVSFIYCGTVQNSTSYDPVAQNMSMVTAALYFAFCQNVGLFNVTVEGTNGTGVVMYNTNGTLNVINSHFVSNNGKPIVGTSNTLSGGGFYAEFCYCDPGFTDNCIQHDNANASYVFRNSSFEYNKASDGSEGTNTFIAANGTRNVAFGRGGGLSLIFKGNASNNNVVIENCHMFGNKATWGGGLFIEFQDYSNHNYVSIEYTKFEFNFCGLVFQEKYGTGGGGARVGFIFFTPKSVQHNTIMFENCFFSDNTGYWGGGLSFYTPPESGMVEATNTLRFVNCTWKYNHAALGSAVDLSVWHPNKTGVLLTVVFYNCTFIGNINNPPLVQTESYLGTGALYSDSIPLAFEGRVFFQNNNGSALALFATGATFVDNCEANFTGNSGWTGGAIALLGNAWLMLYNQTVLRFHGNRATFKGGAISVEITSRHDLLSSRNCFLQYYDQFATPDEWHARFSFENNSAPTGQTIFATSLSSCVWGSSVGKLDYNNTLPYFHFINPKANFSQEIASEIAHISHRKSIWPVIPGKPSQLPLNFTDDIGQPIKRSIWLLDNSIIAFDSNLTANGLVTIISPNNTHLNFSLNVATADPRIVSTTVQGYVLPCPLGFIWIPDHNRTINNSTIGRCRCAYGHTSMSWDGITFCNESSFQAHIQKDFWAGTIDGTYYTGKCPKSYCTLPLYSLLPAEVSEISNTICKPTNRQGTLCGECIHNHCVAINRREFTCTSRIQNYSWIVYIATEFLPSTLLFVAILFFDINLHSGVMGSMVLFFQVYSSLNIYSDGKLHSPGGSSNVTKTIDFLYNIWNLDFFGIWLAPYCLSKRFDTMKVLMMNYASGFYPFFLIFAVYLLGKIRFGGIMGYGRVGTAFRKCKNYLKRLKWKISLKASIISGLATFWTLAYTKLAIVSGLILSLEFVNAKRDENKFKIVVSVQGNISYFTLSHLPYAIPALLILIVFVVLPSLALFLYPLVPQILGKLKCHIDLDSSSSYQAISSRMEAPFIYFKPLLDSFQGKYKPRCEYFAGLLFWYRLALFLTYAFATEEKLFYSNTAASLIFMFIIAAAKPYQKDRNNIILLLTIMNIAFINLISSYNYSSGIYKTVPNILLWFQILLVFCPFLLFAAYILMKVVKKLFAYYKGLPPDGLYVNLVQENYEESDFPAREILHNLAEE